VIDLEKLREMIREVVREEIAAIAATKPGEYITTSEAADEWSLHPGSIRRWIRQGRLPACRTGRQIRIKRADLEALVNGQGRVDDAVDALADRAAARIRRRSA